MFSKFVVLEMPQYTTRSRKGKFQGNQFSQSQEKSLKKALKFAEVKVNDAKPGSNQPLSALSRKLQANLDKTDKEQMPEVDIILFILSRWFQHLNLSVVRNVDNKA